MTARRIPRSHSSFTGRYPDGRGGSIPFESTRERDFIALTRFEAPEAVIYSQPITVTVPKTNQTDGTYHPDFLVERPPDVPRLVEVKDSRLLQKDEAELAAKFEAAELYCASQGWQFEIWTDRHLPSPKMENVHFLLPFRQREADSGIAARILSVLSEVQQLSIGSLIAELSEDVEIQQRSTAELWRLISNGRVEADLDQPLVKASPVWLEPRSEAA